MIIKNKMLLVFLAISAFACSNPKQDIPSVNSSVPVIAVRSAPIPVVAPKTPTIGERLEKAKTYQEMWDICSPLLQDEDQNTKNPGKLCVALWAGKNFKWDMVKVVKNETTPGLVFKNSEKEVGKKLCVSGTIVQISESASLNISEGLLYSNTGQLFNFTNAGSSGNLDKDDNDHGRFCGIVVGTYTYSNSGGGTGHAVDVVGMWDLKENK